MRARLLWVAADEMNVSRLLSHKLCAYVMRMLTCTEDSLAGDSLTALLSVASSASTSRPGVDDHCVGGAPDLRCRRSVPGSANTASSSSSAAVSSLTPTRALPLPFTTSLLFLAVADLPVLLGLLALLVLLFELWREERSE